MATDKVTGGHMSPLNGLRAFSAFAIVVGHFCTNFAPTEPDEWPIASVEYFQAVSIFFILSGVSMAFFYPIVQSKEDKSTFFVKRIARIAPMYYTSLLLSIPSFLAYTTDPVEIICSVLFSLIGIQSFTLLGNSWSGPLWQMSAFAICYIVYPPLSRNLPTYTSNKPRWVVIALGCYLFPLVTLGIFWYLQLPAGIVHNWVITRLPHFVLGCLLGKRLTDLQPVNTQKRLTRADIGTFLMLAGFCTCWMLGIYIGPVGWWTFMLWSEFALLPLHMFWIESLVRSAGHGLTDSLFNLRIVQSLGELSLSIYMLHYPLLYLYTWLRNWSIVPLQFRDRQIMMGLDTLVDGPYGLEYYDLPIYLAILILTSYVSLHFIENPGRKWIISKFAR